MRDLPLIFRLMPALYRNRDADAEGALLALSKALDAARASVRADIEALERDWFVETCDPHLLPFIGELVGLQPFEREAHEPRAIVADTIAFRRRKDSVAAIERRLAALTGWPVRLRRGDARGEVRVEVWLDEAFAFARAAPRPASGDGIAPGCFHLDALGRDIQLVNPPRPFPGIEASFVAALDAPMPLTRDSPPDAMSRAASIYSGDASDPLPPDTIVAGDLAAWDPPPAAPGIRAVLDPALGRLMLLDVPTPSVVAVDYVRGAAARIGGGPYEREHQPPPKDAWLAYVHHAALPDAARRSDGPPAFATLRAALEAFDAVPGPGVIRILDSGRHDVEGLEIGALPDACPPDPDVPRSFLVEAIPGEAPCLVGALALRGRDPGLHVTFAGLWFDGTVTLRGMVHLDLHHCTLHPAAALPAGGAPAVVAHPAGSAARLALHNCLSRSLHLSAGTDLVVRDSVVDGGADGHAVLGGASADVARASFIGAVALRRLDAADTIFDGTLAVAEVEVGAVARSYVLPGARTPLRNACVVGSRELWPAWESLAWGAAGCARLGDETDVRIFTGGSEGGRMGAHHGTQVTRRMALLREGLENYLPPGATIPRILRNG